MRRWGQAAARTPSGAVRFSPPAVLALIYAGLIIVGTIMLRLPAATTAPISWAEAAFTATSAVTVTGLVVVDTGTRFTLFGESVLLLLIQLGGLGLMTFATLVLTLLGLPLRLRQRIILREDLNQTSFGDLARLVGVVLRVVLALEMAGALALAMRWVPQFGWSEGLFASAFHSISAFNNAGFALYPDSLTRWVADPLIVIVISLQFIVGGLGFTVLADLYAHRRWRRLSLHSKLMLAGTAALMAGTLAGFLLLEWSNPGTLGALEGLDAKMLAGWFQAVTPRTAGFNTVDIAALHDSTALMFIALMVIGAGSTSTAGGIKVTTFMVLLLATRAFLQRQTEPMAFGRSIAPEAVMKVLALAVLSLLTLMIATFLMTLTVEAPFLDLAFEAASALGTVGLSRGVTGELDPLGYLVIVTCMFVGRIGPLALALALAAPHASAIRYARGPILIG